MVKEAGEGMWASNHITKALSNPGLVAAILFKYVRIPRLGYIPNNELCQALKATSHRGRRYQSF